ncbi:DNA topoisomerase 3-alpha [Datura stramonium]|uniref:DNA topoisomerase n=1 Tax=Datura stramonium TaxID=4076 RepID=A0ABS8TLA9_DATST|nr:DNA topoisomerase 3-alpha [Datura stramonium]
MLASAFAMRPAIAKAIDCSMFMIRKPANGVSSDSEILQLLFCPVGPFLGLILGFQDFLKHSKLLVLRMKPPRSCVPTVVTSVAEDLYQNGFISYPRTETDCFSEKTDLRTMVQEQQGHPVWGSYAQRLLDPQSGLWRNPSGGGHDDKAHPPIHPTKFSAGESRWSQDHHRVYELVVRHFLACVSQPAVGAETIVEIDIAGESFSACGRVILADSRLKL